MDADGGFVTDSCGGTNIVVELLGVRIRLDGSAAPASVIDLDRDLVVPDGIRMVDPAQLLVAEVVGRLTLVNVHTGATTVVSESLDPSSVY